MKIKCIDNRGRSYLTNGASYNAWFIGGELWSDSDSNFGTSLYHGDLSITAHGVFEMAEEEKSHPHADLMLKYAMIAQYDDKPWESFEVFLDGEWKASEHEAMYACFNYRLKPQEPKIEFGQTWIDANGVEVIVSYLSNNIVFTAIEVGGLVIPWSFSEGIFLNNFKRK